MSTKRKTGVVLSDADYRRRYPTSGTANKICLPAENSLWLPSRILPLNWQLGGGILYGKILELFGEESTGKSLMSMDFGYCCQQLGGEILWQDAEASFDVSWAMQNGLDPTKIHLLPEENVIEIISDWQMDTILRVRARLTNNEPILLVVDSTAALDTQLNMDTADSDQKAEMGNRAKAIYRMLRKRTKLYARYGVCVIYINQLRQKVGASQFEDPDTTPGGSAMKFFASQRIGLYRGKRIKDEDKNYVGNFVYIRTKKNKVAPPKDNTQANVYFTPFNGTLGYDKYFYLPELLENMGVIQRKAAVYYYKGEKLAHETKIIALLKSNDKLRKNLIRRSGINTISVTKEKINAISNNRYPVKNKSPKDEADSE